MTTFANEIHVFEGAKETNVQESITGILARLYALEESRPVLSHSTEKISNEKLELFAGMEPIDAVDKTVKSMASNLLQTRADLAAAREELERYRWIPVGERLPEDGERVFVLMRNGYQVIAGHFHSGWINDAGCETFNVTHWMPLPLPPKEGEG